LLREVSFYLFRENLKLKAQGNRDAAGELGGIDGLILSPFE
jgi:hypothetical protein